MGFHQFINWVNWELLFILVSVGVSFLVLIGQRRAAIRESVEQLDDRKLDGISGFKFRILMVDFSILNNHTILEFSINNMTNQAGVSNAVDIDGYSSFVDKDLPAIATEVRGVEDAWIEPNAERCDQGEGESEDEGLISETRLFVRIRGITPIQVRAVAKLLISRLQAEV